MRRLRRLRGRRRRRAARVSARASSASRPGRRRRAASSSAARTTTPGASASARRGSSSARPPTATRASTCRSPIATTKRSAAGRRSVLGEHRRHATGSSRSPTRSGRSTSTAASPPPPATPSTRPATYPKRVLEPHGVRLRADRAPRRHVRARAATAPTSARSNAVEPARQRRRVDRPDHGRGRPGRQRLGHRLVQLHRPAQPDAGRLQDRQGERLRDRTARQDSTGASIGSCITRGGDRRPKSS